jgi:SAM-dependent methyltransferase
MPPVERYRWDTPEYASAFATLLRATDERVRIDRLLRETMAHYPAESSAVDWGAGSGALTRVLLERFRRVYAVEPSPSLRATLETNCPAAQVIAGTIMSAGPPEPVEVGIISHVLYHVSDHKWGAHVIRAASFLSPGGVLLVTLNDPDAGPNRMLDHFGAWPFDLYASLEGTVRRHPEFDFSFVRVPAVIHTRSFEDTVAVARLTLCDRDEDAFSRPPTEDEFRRYVRDHFWNEAQGQGGWPHSVVVCFVRRNALVSA